MPLLDSFKAARRVSTPLVAINTPDQSATIQNIADGVNGDTPIVVWDFCSGLVPLNPEGAEAIGAACVCPECGFHHPHERGIPCHQMTCPQCGQRLARK